MESLKLLKNKRCDIKPIIGIGLKSVLPYNATQEYFKDSISLVTRTEQPFIYDLNDLDDKKIVIAKGFNRFLNFIKKKYPNIKLIKVKDIDTALKKVASEEVFGYIGTALTSSYKIQKSYSTKLKIVNNFQDFKIGVGVLETEPELLSILNKAMDMVTIQEERIVINKWIFTRVEKIKKYVYLWYIIGVALFIIALFLYRQRILNKHNKELKIKADEALAASKAKSEFLANMSHEIRTPLNAIVGFVDILKENETDKEKLNQLSIIDKSSRSLVSIINEILDFSKLQSGKTQVEKIDFDTFEEFEAIGGLFKAKCSEKNILLNINIAENTPKYLNSDIQKIIQVIANLISNAIKFSQNSKKIELKIYYNFDTKRLFVSVIDEGIGIPKDKQKDIFNAFSQADNSTTRKYGGTGLGLSISSSFIKLLDGMLELESIEGFGSRFHFSIPVAIGKPIEKIKSNDINHNIESKKILLVEDNKANQMFMKVILKKMKLEFDIANDGVEAVENFKNNKYDAILMDENMPNMNGIEATKNILEYEKQNNLKHTPIIALTANALSGDRERFLAAGMDEYLTKPLNKKKLAEILGKFLKDDDNVAK